MGSTPIVEVPTCSTEPWTRGNTDMRQLILWLEEGFSADTAPLTDASLVPPELRGLVKQPHLGQSTGSSTVKFQFSLSTSKPGSLERVAWPV